VNDVLGEEMLFCRGVFDEHDERRQPVLDLVPDGSKRKEKETKTCKSHMRSK
jgi:hypothetical protein